MTLDLKYYLAVLVARLHYVFLIFSAVTALAVTLALKLPPTYESSATLLLASAQIPTTLATPTVSTADLEQLQVLQQRVTTRPTLLEIARKFSVFPKIGTLSPDEIVDAMEKATTISIRTGRDQAALMEITFAASRGQTAADVVNEYVTRILADDVAARTGQAQDTLQFFKQEVDRLQGDLAAQSAKIVTFQNANADALPSTLTARLQQQATLQDRQASVERDIASLQDQKQRLTQLFQATGQVTGEAALSPEAKLLAQARTDLAQARGIYAPDNPKIRMIEARVAQLEETVKGQTPTPGADPAPAAPTTVLDAQVADIDARIAQLQTQRGDIGKALDALKVTIDRTSQVGVELDTLNRDYGNIQTQYNAATDRLAKASTGERIEALSKGQRINVLDAAAVEDKPTRPNRPKIAILGAVAGLGLGLGFVFLLEMLNTAVRRPVDLVQGLDITPIGVIPYIRTPGEQLRRRVLISSLFLAVAAGVPAGLYAIDTYYLPLDIVLAKINAKLGL